MFFKNQVIPRDMYIGIYFSFIDIFDLYLLYEKLETLILEQMRSGCQVLGDVIMIWSVISSSSIISMVSLMNKTFSFMLHRIIE